MKKTFYLFAILTLCIGFVMTSCGDDEPTPSIDGTVVEPTEWPEIASNTIMYTSTDGKTVIPFNADAFDAKIVSNTYDNGYGTIIFDGEITTIGEKAFYECRTLQSMKIPNTVTTIGNGAFYWSNALMTIEIPNSVTAIEEYAFSCCEGLTTVTIPNSVTKIGEYAFQFCTGLTSMDIPNSVTTIGRNAFYSCTELTTVEIPNSVTTIGRAAFYDCHKLESIVIPDAVTTLEYGTFYNCQNLLSAAIGNSVTTIESGAFYNCGGLKSVVMSNSLQNVGEYVFEGCVSLPVENDLSYADTYLVEAVDKSLNTYNIKDGTKWIGVAAFKRCTNLTSIVIPNSVTIIGDYAFKSCSNLTSIVIPNSVTSIKKEAFYSCFNLTSINIPSSVSTVGDYAFQYCTSLPVENNLRYADTYLVEAVDKSLNTYNLKDGTKWIGTAALKGCTKLASVEIPNSVTTIESEAFAECTRLKEITSLNTTPPSIGAKAFENVPVADCVVKVPAESVETYKQADGWKNFGGIEAIETEDSAE